MCIISRKNVKLVTHNLVWIFYKLGQLGQTQNPFRSRTKVVIENMKIRVRPEAYIMIQSSGHIIRFYSEFIVKLI